MTGAASEGLKAAACDSLGARWPRCRVQCMRNLRARAGKPRKPVAGAAARAVPAGKEAGQAQARSRAVAGNLRSARHGTNPPGRGNEANKRRTKGFGICPDREAAIRLARAWMPQQRGQCPASRRAGMRASRSTWLKGDPLVCSAGGRRRSFPRPCAARYSSLRHGRAGRGRCRCSSGRARRPAWTQARWSRKPRTAGASISCVCRRGCP